MKGIINSFQSLGAVDGPGVRFVVFMQGCPLKCSFCHNPESWTFKGGNEYTPREVFNKILRYKPYFGKAGGVTISGGEALSQWEFCYELFSLCKNENIHTALDTSGIGNLSGCEKLLTKTDLVMCDIKFCSNEKYLKHTTVNLDSVLKFLKLTEQMNVPIWIRHVIIPTITDSENDIKEIIRLATSLKNLEKIEFLPFRKLCVSKYEQLKMEFKLKDIPECSEETLKRLTSFIPEKFR